jgi:histidinol dehydrogenase
MLLIESTDEAAIARILDRSAARDPAIEQAAARIVADVRARGDAAVREYAARFDGLDGDFEISRAEMRRESARVPADVTRAVRAAARRIRHVAAKQVPRRWRTSPAAGVTIEQRVTPLDRVGCYVPGGRYPLPSSLLMTAIPARVAGVREVVAVCPKPDPTVLLAALEAGVTRVFRLGGAHAIAALAYGTATVPRVDKIVGPGNAYVAAAKALVSVDCAIDFFAGPTEILIVSTSGRADWIAADLIAQAEHDDHARAVFVTPSRRLARAVASEVDARTPAAGPARTSLAANGAIVVTRTLAEAIALSNRMAPEHVVCDTHGVASRLTRAGTVFVGGFSAQAAGDYVTGSNHVLPTSGAARARGGLSAADFVRVATVQTVTRAGIRRIGPDGVALATAEGLSAHADSMRMRWTGVSERAQRSEPPERPAHARSASARSRRSFSGGGSEPAKRRASDGAGESEGRSPSDKRT